ncbi:MAG: LPS-assembly protein LptD [Rhizobiaceae bacterium MnEN-MB40S]|nr:MAG: LPS-assembly protein LptD [Rhizobiaceae bacterium MnEN-MB40S]
MDLSRSREKKSMRIVGLVTALSAVLAGSVAIPSAIAQSTPNSGSDLNINVSPDARLILTANELVYDYDNQIVTASGNVQIDYDKYKMVARRLVYDQNSGRLKAYGDIELIEPSGNVIYAEELDVTDDFADGFVNALRIETPDDTYIVADSAQRIGGDQAVFNNGVYTACEVCQDKPKSNKAPLWQVKARRVIQNGETQTITLQHARFELFGMPIAYIPTLQVPDHTVERKSGFLTPDFVVSDVLGVGLTVPYFLVTGPRSDITFQVTGYTRQGFLGQAEFRRQFDNGAHVLTTAGIYQLDSNAFEEGTVDAENDARGMIASKGDFRINPRWIFGWDVMLQSDNSFSNTYGIEGYRNRTVPSNIYLTGLEGRNFFDLQAFYYDVQSINPQNMAEEQQPIVHPSLDYNKTFDQPVAGGELSFDANILSLTRREAEEYPFFDAYRGVKGTNTRLTAELDWRRTFYTDVGLLLTPILGLRGDVNYLDVDRPLTYPGPFVDANSVGRYMATAGLEARYPILFSTENSSHIVEPIAQIFVRPDEQYAGGLPNEDAQSFIFDATNLFEQDKFSGYDRIEGGTRANLGIRYTGTFDNGMSLRGVFGQSFQLAGLNSFATDDLVNVGASSGLETARSDYVGGIGLDLPNGLTFTTQGRFDEADFSLQRLDLGGSYSGRNFSTAISYTSVVPQPGYGTDSYRHEFKGAASVRFAEYWRAFGAIEWDLENDIITNNTWGFGYDDECTAISLAYTQTRDENEAVDWSIGVRISLRTLGDFKVGRSEDVGYDSKLWDNNDNGSSPFTTVY